MTKSIILAAIFVLALAVALACTPPEPVVERVEVTREVEVPVAVPQTVEVKVPFPQTRIVEQTVEVTREVPITVVVTATPPPATPATDIITVSTCGYWWGLGPVRIKHD